MNRFVQRLQSDAFVVTSELNPPKGIDLAPLLEKAAGLGPWVDAVNVTDSASARMAMAPLAASKALAERGIEPILQLTSRDRNRLALQADMLAAAALGINNLLVMGGDPPANGDHPDAKPVFDLYASQIIAAARALSEGHDMAGNALHGAPPAFCTGAVVNPGAPALAEEITRMHEKVTAGAAFLQTQAVYEVAAFERFLTALGEPPVPLLAGIIPLKSVHMAHYLNEHIPGIEVPRAIIAELEAAEDTGRCAIDIAARTVREIAPMCRGVHIMAIGWEAAIPDILAGAGIQRAA